MNNKPVAYGKYLEEHDYWVTASGIIPNPKEGYVPLYTHPAKTLTDEEMWKVCLEGGHVDCIADVDWEFDGMEELKHQYLRLCKAILRQAQSSCNGFCGEYECKENQENCKRKAGEK